MTDTSSAPHPSPAAGEAERLPSSLGFPVVGLGASAGGIATLQRFFENMPADNGMAFVVILHLSPKHQSNVAAILQRSTRMPVVEVAETRPIERQHVYVISPSLDLVMVDGTLSVAQAARPRGRHVAIDVFFRTLAEAHHTRASCVVLSGSGTDGAVGLTRVKERGGVTLAQSPEDAEYDGMPSAAIATGMVDVVLPVVDMPQRLIEIWRNAQRIALPHGHGLPQVAGAPPPGEAEARAEEALRDIVVTLRERTGHDFRHYKRTIVLRRLERRLQVNELPDLPSYRKFLDAQPDETGALLKDLLIGVTNFFRDRESFDALERELAGRLFDAARPREQVRAWVAGCATGEEAYSVAMLFAEGAAGLRRAPEIQVFATDIDDQAIAVARLGVYPQSIAADVTPRRLREHFSVEGDTLRVSKAIRDSVLFASHDVLSDPPFSRLDLVCCRNLLICFDRVVQEQALRTFHFALRPGGLLFLGGSESVDVVSELFAIVDKKHRIYRAHPAPEHATRVPALASSSLLPPRQAPAFPVPGDDRMALAQLHRRLVEDRVLASVLVDEHASILHVSDQAARYLRYVGGTPPHNLLTVIREELRIELRAALSLAWETHKSVEARRVRTRIEGRDVVITMTTTPARDPASGTTFMLVLFVAAEVSFALEVGADAPPRDPMLAQLEAELRRTRDRLQGSLGQTAGSNEELRAANEELQAINEELRSATEELETSKEELQSVNEELITLNLELKDKVEETGKVNDDLRNLIASTDIATIFVDRELRIKLFTPRATEIFNIIASDAGRPLLDITHRLDYDQMTADAGEAFRTLKVVEREVGGPGERRFLVRVQPYRTHENRIKGAVLTFVDISTTRRAEDWLHGGDLHMRLVSESMRDFAIITLGVDGVLTSWNKGAELLFGWSAEEAIGHSAAMIFTPDDRAAGVPDGEIRRARDEGRALDERWHVRKNGSRVYCSGIMTPLRSGGKLRGFAKIARDLTEARLAESQRDEVLETEKQLRGQLQEASVLKDEFLAVMSHELKHPLNLIHVNAELLTRMPEVRDVPAVARAAHVIRRTVVSQAKIIDDLLDLSRLHTGKLSLSFASIQWSAIVERVVEAVRADAAAKKLQLTMAIDPAASAVFADGLRVEQIVWNLVSNALKFTPEGGTVQIALTIEGRQARLDVSDSGQGIDRAFLPHVFDMFRQADSRTTRQEGGLGIGLALVKHLTELQGGRVAVDSPGRGEGSRFSVWLPRSGIKPSDAPAAPELPALSGMRILLVDDAEDTLDFFGMLLELEGARVTRCVSGATALAAAEGADFDLILSDIGMPVMDGHQLIAELRRRPRSAQVPAVALTGYGRPQDERLALEAGFDAHLSKPVGLEALIQTVTRLRRKPDAGAGH